MWFEPTEVWEIRGADLTISPVHKAAVGRLHPDRGVSLRSGPATLHRSGFLVSLACCCTMLDWCFGTQLAFSKVTPERHAHLEQKSSEAAAGAFSHVGADWSAPAALCERPASLLHSRGQRGFPVPGPAAPLC